MDFASGPTLVQCRPMGMGRGKSQIVLSLGLLVAVLATTRAQAFNSLDTSSYGTIKNWCQNMAGKLEQVELAEDALNCADFYFYNQDLEDGNELFEKVLNFTKRAVEIDPSNYKSYSSVMWLHYSRWVEAGRVHSLYGQYKNDLKLTYDWAKIAEKKFFNNAEALREIAQVLAPIWYFYDRTLLNRVVGLYQRAEALSKSFSFKIRCRLNIAHYYRKNGDTDLAIKGYRWVLELDPNNSIALGFLKTLGAE